MIYGTPEFDELLRDVITKGTRHDCYAETCDHAEEMSWHFFGVRPDKLLEKTRPNEDPAVTDYRKENYEPITKSAADKSINIVSKIFNPNLYSIRWKEKNASTDELRAYTLEYYPDYNSIVNYVKDVLLRKMLADPNGVAVITVDEIPDVQSVKLAPVMKVYGSKAVFYFDDDHYLISTRIEDEMRYYFDYYDSNRTISFVAYMDKDSKDLIIEVEKEYVYDFGELPVWKLRGLSESMDNGDVIFKSFFSSAAPYWNLAIVHESDLFGAYIRHLFPQRYELSEVCTYKFSFEGMSYPCRNGKIAYPKGPMECPHCEGSGYNPVGPYGVYRYTKDKLTESGPIGIDPVGYINTPIDATKMLEERAHRMITEGMWAINMDVEDEVGENQSGVAKAIDRSAQYDMLANIASVIFGIHLTNAYYFINKYRNGVEAVSVGRDEKVIDKNLPEINQPTHFDVGSVSELLNNFKVAKDSGLDPNYLQMKQIEIQSRDLTTNPDLKIFTTLLLELDPLPGLDVNTIDRNVSKGYNRKVDAVIHFNLKSFVERAQRENKDFYKWPREQQLVKLEEYGNQMITANKPTVDLSMMQNVA